MSSRPEVLRFLRDQVGDRRLSYETSLQVVQDRDDVDMLDILEALEMEFSIELPGEMLMDVDTLSDLCDLVIEAEREATEPPPPGDTMGGGAWQQPRG